MRGESAQRAEQARLRAVVRSASAGIAGVSSSTRELCERWLPQAASVSEARACRRDAAQTRKHAEPACTQRAGEPLCTAPAVDSASPPRFLARVLEGEQVLEHAQHARPARPARRHTRAARSPRRAARTARLEQQEQLEKQPSLCRSSMPSLHTEILWPCWPVCVPARPAHAPGESDRRGARRRRLIMPHAAGSSRSGLQAPAGQLRATQHFPDKICLALPCLALPCLALPCLAQNTGTGTQRTHPSVTHKVS
jgi:hypothetical protein